MPNGDKLFMRAHKSHIVGGDLQPGVFRDQGAGMSTSWEKYGSAHQAHQRAKTPKDNAVISLRAGPVREVPQLVKHTPIPHQDRSHTDIIGDKKAAEVRVKLLKIFAWEIPLEP